MRSIANAVISFLELLEAEGRQLRKKTVATAESLMVVFFALALVFVGIVVAFYALCIWLGEYVSNAAAAFIVAVLLSALGGIALVKARARARDGGSPEKEEATTVRQDGETNDKT